MKVPDVFTNLAGEWSGSNRLYAEWTPENRIRDSASNASVAPTVGGHFLKVDYDWTFEDETKEGTMLFSFAKDGTAQFVWCDSFHQSGGFLVSRGDYDTARAAFKGSYSVPGHPDWGWDTEFEAAGEDEFAVTMFNISPEGERYDAVEMKFRRKS